jgi:purine-cytosine permease-like protein
MITLVFVLLFIGVFSILWETFAKGIKAIIGLKKNAIWVILLACGVIIWQFWGNFESSELNKISLGVVLLVLVFLIGFLEKN